MSNLIKKDDAFNIGNFNNNYNKLFHGYQNNQMDVVMNSYEEKTRSQIGITNETYDVLIKNNNNEKIYDAVTGEFKYIKTFIVNNHSVIHYINNMDCLFENTNDIEIIDFIKIEIGGSTIYNIGKSLLDLLKSIYNISYYDKNGHYKIPINFLLSTFEYPFAFYKNTYHELRIIVEFKEEPNSECLLNINYSSDKIILAYKSLNKFSELYNELTKNYNIKFNEQTQNIIQNITYQLINIDNTSYTVNLKNFTGPTLALIFYFEDFQDLLYDFTIVLNNKFELGPYQAEYLKSFIPFKFNYHISSDRTVYILSFNDQDPFIKTDKYDRSINFSRIDYVKCIINSCSNNVKLHLYSINYNIARSASGMFGQVFSG